MTLGYRGSYGQSALAGGEGLCSGKGSPGFSAAPPLSQEIYQLSSKIKQFPSEPWGVFLRIAVIDPLDPISRFKGSRALK